jgi:hypothetical protein
MNIILKSSSKNSCWSKIPFYLPNKNNFWLHNSFWSHKIFEKVRNTVNINSQFQTVELFWLISRKSLGLVGRAKVKRFQTLSKKLMICSPKYQLTKFQPPIRSKSARIKTRTEKNNGYDLRCVLLALVLIRAGLLRIEGWNFGGGFLGLQIINFLLRVWNPLIFARPSD